MHFDQNLHDLPPGRSICRSRSSAEVQDSDATSTSAFSPQPSSCKVLQAQPSLSVSQASAPNVLPPACRTNNPRRRCSGFFCLNHSSLDISSDCQSSLRPPAPAHDSTGITLVHFSAETLVSALSSSHHDLSVGCMACDAGRQHTKLFSGVRLALQRAKHVHPCLASEQQGQMQEAKKQPCLSTCPAHNLLGLQKGFFGKARRPPAVASLPHLC